MPTSMSTKNLIYLTKANTMANTTMQSKSGNNTMSQGHFRNKSSSNSTKLIKKQAKIIS